MEDLTQRQVDILRCIIQEYSDSGEPVGSEILEKKYKLGVSPATIRNEMVELARKKYIEKSHFSAGRVPTAKAFRFYINHIMKKKSLSTFDEVAYKNSIWDERNDEHRLFSHATRALSQRTGLLSLIATEDGNIYYSGIAQLLDKDEFLNLDVSRSLFSLLEETFFWAGILKRMRALESPVLFILGEEDFHNHIFDPCGSVFAQFHGRSKAGILGVVGPKRMAYETVTPQVEHLSRLIQDIMFSER